MNPISDYLKMALEVSVFAVGIYAVMRFLRETRGAGVIRGLSLLLLIGIVTFSVLINTFELRRLEKVALQITQFAILGLIVVFQPEIRRAIVHLGETPIFAAFRRKERSVPRLLRGVARLAKDRVGALIAIEREGSLANFTASGILLDAEINSYLVESIFSKSSPLHDGAVVVRDNRIVAAKCVLPLSENPAIDKRLGTRHRAAVGLTEECDALAVVVSEETGKISYALNGKLTHNITLEQLEMAIEASLGLPGRKPRREPAAEVATS